MSCPNDIVRYQSGFTLIELMVVLTLIAILSAMIVPEMRGSMEDATLRSATRQWVEVFGLANSRAIASQEQVRVRIDPTQGRFQIEHVGSIKGRRKHFVPLTDSSAFGGKLDPRVSVSLQTGGTNGSRGAPSTGSRASDGRRSDNQQIFSGLATTVRFFPDGTCDEARLNLRDLSGHRMTLRLNPVTARIVLQEPP